MNGLVGGLGPKPTGPALSPALKFCVFSSSCGTVVAFGA